MAHNAGIQMHGSRKPLNNVQPIQQKNKHMMKERLKKLLSKKNFLDKRTVKWLENQGLINTNI